MKIKGIAMSIFIRPAFLIATVFTASIPSALAEDSRYDPFADKVLTCQEMRRYPHLIFTGGIDLGSGSRSPIQVDYECRHGLQSQPFLKKLAQLTEEVRSDG